MAVDTSDPRRQAEMLPRTLLSLGSFAQRVLRVGTVIAVLACGAVPSAKGEDRVTAAVRAVWLKGHMAPLMSIDPAVDDFSDLEPIRLTIADARIVQLSEQSHGDGATYHARTRLVKFLHQKCG